MTLVTAVLFYFGWRRSDVQAGAMSIDVSLFGFSSQDYVLRSISSLYLPLLVILGLGLAWLWLHLRVTLLLRSDMLRVGRAARGGGDVDRTGCRGPGRPGGRLRACSRWPPACGSPPVGDRAARAWTRGRPVDRAARPGHSPR